MKNLIILLVSVLMMSCASQKIENADVIRQNPYLIGKWSGEGRLLGRQLNEQTGPMQVELIISNEHDMELRIGDAQVNKLKIAETKYGFEIRGITNTAVKENLQRDKDHAILLLVLSDEDKNSKHISDANFHLKSNYAFDISMIVGGVTLKQSSVN